MIVIQSMVINAGIPEVWQAITDPDRIRNWMWQDQMTVDTSWEEGSPVTMQFFMNGTTLTNKGKVLAFKPEQLLSYTYWNKLARLPDAPEYYAAVRFELEGLAEGTLLTLTQKSPDHEAGPEHIRFYWNVTLHQLKKLVEEGSTFKLKAP